MNVICAKIEPQIQKGQKLYHGTAKMNDSGHVIWDEIWTPIKAPMTIRRFGSKTIPIVHSSLLNIKLTDNPFGQQNEDTGRF